MYIKTPLRSDAVVLPIYSARDRYPTEEARRALMHQDSLVSLEALQSEPWGASIVRITRVALRYGVIAAMFFQGRAGPLESDSKVPYRL